MRQKVEILPFSDKDSVDTIAIGYNRSRYLSRIAQDFIDLALQTYQQEPVFGRSQEAR